MKVDAERIITERELLGLSQKALAREAGVAVGTMARLEAGGFETRPATVKRVADALGLEVKDLRIEPKKRVALAR